ncbi:hypothetical protein HOY80DRAFT_963747 [Tuber brumale]|nr:hypothetical protein HOY80DRAFT_963747 [Tuber brumale]
MVEIALGGEAIKAVPPDELILELFGMTSCADLHRYRPIGADNFANRILIRAIGYAGLPQQFSTISYIWKGNPLLEGQPPPLGSLKVVGADGADPLSIDVIEGACYAALDYGQLLI